MRFEIDEMLGAYYGEAGLFPDGTLPTFAEMDVDGLPSVAILEHVRGVGPSVTIHVDIDLDAETIVLRRTFASRAEAETCAEGLLDDLALRELILADFLPVGRRPKGTI